jgi:Sulfotransferase domain
MSLLRVLRRKASRTSIRVPVVWYRHRGLGANDAFVASYPRSGSTWLRFLLLELLTLNDTAGFESVNQMIPDVGGQSSSPSLLENGGRLIKTHEAYREEYGKAVYLVRDVRDVVISEFAYENANERISEDFDAFVMLSLKGRVNGYGCWQDHLTSWIGSPLASDGRLLVVKFEALKARTEDTLIEILEFLGVSRDRASVRQAIANNNLQRMKDKEDRSPQTAAYSRERADGEQKRFIRSGSTGGWRSRLSEAQVQLIESQAGPGLARMGYPLDTPASRTAPVELASSASQQ